MPIPRLDPDVLHQLTAELHRNFIGHDPTPTTE
jgi:hypothetical protein